MRVLKGACLRALLCAVALCAWTSFARANSVEISFVSAVGGVFTYDASLTPGNIVVNPDDVAYFYDFAGFTGGSFTPSAALLAATLGTGDYTFVEYTENDSAAPGVASKRTDIAPGDSASVAEVRFDYTGSSVLNPGPLSMYLGFFTLTSIYTNTEASWTQSTDTSSPGGIPNINLRPTTVAAVPLPPAVWAGMSLMGVLGFKGFRRQRMISSEI